ncbi:MAG: hypothetical protein HC933_22585 [Pleurocapsa sp. SU_196_0]|nr:hypothetical protein [Pleurocapsa sp. SU_196_0]
MNLLWFLIFLMTGVALVTYGGVMVAFGKRRNVGLIFGAAAVMMGLSAPIGVLIGDGTPVAAAPALLAHWRSRTPPLAKRSMHRITSWKARVHQVRPRVAARRRGHRSGECQRRRCVVVLRATTPTRGVRIRTARCVRQRQVETQRRTGIDDRQQRPVSVPLRITTNERQTIPGAIAVLSRDGTEIARGEAPSVFTNLEAGEYTYTLEADGYVTSKVNAASLPRNKNLSVYLDPQR